MGWNEQPNVPNLFLWQFILKKNIQEKKHPFVNNAAAARE